MSKTGKQLRLGVQIDAAYRVEREGGAEVLYSGDELLGFTGFLDAMRPKFGSLTLIGRRTEDRAVTPYRVSERLGLAPLPNYPSLRALPAVLAALPATLRGMWRALDDLDAISVSAAHPLGLALIACALLRRRPVAILARQDSMAYFESRLPGRRWCLVLVVMRVINRIFLALGRRLPTVAVGVSIAEQYGAPRPNVISFTVNRVSRDEIPAAPPARDWSGQIELLAVGRIEPEKNPLLAADLLVALERGAPGRYRLTWAGAGAMSGDLERHARELGVADRLQLPGFVPIGPELDALYRRAHCFVHISRTEGVPGVIMEAMSHGIPIVATEVGGIGAVTDDGAAARLVRPDDAEGMASAVASLEGDAAGRTALVEAGLRIARANCLEVQSERVANFLNESL